MGPSDFTDLIAPQLDRCRGLQSLLDAALSCCLSLTGTTLGNVQLMDWTFGYLTIAAQRGFDPHFVNRFRRVSLNDGTACGRAVRDRRCVVIEDVFADGEFAPYREIADQAGFRAVQSTPLISRSGAFLGVLSTHFANRHRPTDKEALATKVLAEMTANAIIRQRIVKAGSGRANYDKQIAASLDAVEHSWQVLRQVRPRL